MRLPSSSSPGSSRSGSGCWGCGGCGGVGFFRFGIVVAAMAAVGREGGGEGARADSVSVSGGRAAAARRSPAISLPGGCGALVCGHLTFFPTSGHAPSSSFSATPGGGHEPSLSRLKNNPPKSLILSEPKNSPQPPPNKSVQRLCREPWPRAAPARPDGVTSGPQLPWQQRQDSSPPSLRSFIFLFLFLPPSFFFFPKVRAAPCPRGHQEAEAQKSSPASRHQPLQEASGGLGPAVWRSAASLHPRARRC